MPDRARRSPVARLDQKPANEVVDGGGADGLQVGDMRFKQVTLELAQRPHVGADGLHGEVEEFQLLPVAVEQHVIRSQSGVNVHRRSGFGG